MRLMSGGQWCVARSTRALHFTGTDNVEQAITWIVEHEADADLDEPLLVPKVACPSVLLAHADKHGMGKERPLW